MPKSNTKNQTDEDNSWSIAMKSAVALLGGLILVAIIFGILLVIVMFNFH